jgi:hypothetical protein
MLGAVWGFNGWAGLAVVDPGCPYGPVRVNVPDTETGVAV